MADPFPCPDCQVKANVIAGRRRSDGELIRYRHCPECNRDFKTTQKGRQPEIFFEWHNPMDAKEDEIEPLDMATVGTKQDKRERLRAAFVCCKGRANGRSKRVRKSGYMLDSGQAFYQD